ncbi:MAG: chromate resistance protein [Firmicutes bacterium]|nr:chromate resistance protein [Bacillota bacterium]
MKWVTRENANVDRVACPWLIRRFVDPSSEFFYVPAAEVLTVAQQQGAIPYDVPNVELGHVDGRCSFESIILKYDLSGDPALAALAQVVHAADVEGALSESPFGPGLKAIAHGFKDLLGKDDLRKIELESPIYDALYIYFQHELNTAQ